MHHMRNILRYLETSAKLSPGNSRGYLTWSVCKEGQRLLLYRPPRGKITSRAIKGYSPTTLLASFYGALYHTSSSHYKDTKNDNKKNFKSSKGIAMESPGLSKSAVEEASISSSGSDNGATPVQSSYVKIVPKANVPKTSASTTDNLRLTAPDIKKRFLLEDEDISKLTGMKQRSPYSSADYIMVYLEKDARALAHEKHGGQAELIEKRNQQEAFEKRQKLQIEDISKLSKSIIFLPPKGNREKKGSKQSPETDHGTIRACKTAVAMNVVALVAKAVVFFHTGYDSLFAEMMHSVVDSLNQALLLYGVYQAGKGPDSLHPYGYIALRPLSSFVSALIVFSFGGGMSIYHGVSGLCCPADVISPIYAYGVLLASGFCEAVSLVVTYREIRRKMTPDETIKNFVNSWKEPTLNVIFLEDSAAVLGICIAILGVGLTQYTGYPLCDSVGSICIGILLCSMGGFIATRTFQTIIGKSISPRQQANISADLERDAVVSGVHDVKTTDMGGVTKYKAEVDIDGKVVTRNYLIEQDKQKIFQEMKSVQNPEDAEAILEKHGEGISNQVGIEIDRLEKVLKDKHPHLRHIDIEIN